MGNVGKCGVFAIYIITVATEMTHLVYRNERKFMARPLTVAFLFFEGVPSQLPASLVVVLLFSVRPHNAIYVGGHILLQASLKTRILVTRTSAPDKKAKCFFVVIKRVT